MSLMRSRAEERHEELIEVLQTVANSLADIYDRLGSLAAQEPQDEQGPHNNDDEDYPWPEEPPEEHDTEGWGSETFAAWESRMNQPPPGLRVDRNTWDNLVSMLASYNIHSQTVPAWRSLLAELVVETGAGMYGPTPKPRPGPYRVQPSPGR